MNNLISTHSRVRPLPLVAGAAKTSHSRTHIWVPSPTRGKPRTLPTSTYINAPLSPIWVGEGCEDSPHISPCASFFSASYRPLGEPLCMRAHLSTYPCTSTIREVHTGIIGGLVRQSPECAVLQSNQRTRHASWELPGFRPLYNVP